MCDSEAKLFFFYECAFIGADWLGIWFMVCLLKMMVIQHVYHLLANDCLHEPLSGSGLNVVVLLFQCWVEFGSISCCARDYKRWKLIRDSLAVVFS